MVTDLVKINLDNIKDTRLDKIHQDIFNLLFNDTIWLAGGAIRSLLTGEIPSDYDLFFKDQKVLLETSTLLEEWGYTKVFQCPKGSLMTYIGTEDNIKVQLISPRYYDSAEILLDSFDFTTTLAAIDEGYLYISKSFIKSVRNKELVLHKLTYPAATINRAYKYKAKGYNIVNCLLDIAVRLYNKDENIIDIGVYYID